VPAIAPVLLHERPLAPHCPLIQRLQAGDAEVVEEPSEQPYGIRDCAPAIGRAT
jgi:hypothetical protein